MSTKTCPSCGADVPEAAPRCKHCFHDFTEVPQRSSSGLMGLLVELNRMGKTILVATHDMNLIRAAKAQVAARVLRIRDRAVQLAGADL